MQNLRVIVQAVVCSWKSAGDGHIAQANIVGVIVAFVIARLAEGTIVWHSAVAVHTARRGRWRGQLGKDFLILWQQDGWLLRCMLLTVSRNKRVKCKGRDCRAACQSVL